MRTTNLRICHLILLLLLCICAASTEKTARNFSPRAQLPRGEPPPKGFVILPPSKDVLNRPDCRKVWEVFKQGDATQIREKSPGRTITVLPFKIDEPFILTSYHHVQQVDDGWLIGFDGGEWGGGLLWFSPDGSKQKKLVRGNVRGLIKSSTGIFVVTGLQHMGLSEGKIFHVKKGERGDWKAELLVDFGTYPHTFTQELPDSLLVVVGNQYELSPNATDYSIEKPGSLLRIKASGEVESLLISQELGQLQPNSMTVSQSGVIYLGAWCFVVRLTPSETTYKQERFVPINCYYNS